MEGRRVSSSTRGGALAALLLLVSAASTQGFASAGSLRGSIRWVGGEPPAERWVENTTDPDACGVLHTTGEVRIGEHGGIANVIVRLADAPATRSTPTSVLLLDNRDCEFHPTAAVLTVGSTVVARNRDATIHTVHFYGPEERNLALPLIDVEIPVRLDQPGLYAVKCDVHGWMEAFLRVDPHPWHAVTDAHGRYEIGSVPPGSYTVEAWRPRLGAREGVVEIDSRGTAELDLAFSADP